jgi:endonuclease I
MKIFYFTIGLFFISLNYYAQQTYYNGVDLTLSGMALKNELATKITNTHTNSLSYSEAESAIKVVDIDPQDNTNAKVLLVYGFSSSICPASTNDDNDHRRRNKNSDGGGNTCEWNREHTFPKSLGHPNLGTSGPGADAHHLRACDVQRNSERGSKVFADGSGNSHSMSSNSWYPGDEWKGDMARMMMYMYLRYGNRCLPTYVGSGSTVASDSNMVQLFLEWNAEDPVSQYEVNRNNYLENANNDYGQGNRNPFIDNPYLATRIWGGPVAQDIWGIYLSDMDNLLASLKIYPNPSNDVIYIESDELINEYTIFDITGKKVQDGTIMNNQIQVDVLESGMYFLNLSSDNNSIIKKIVVTD